MCKCKIHKDSIIRKSLPENDLISVVNSWIFLEEAKLENKIVSWFKKSQRKTLQKFKELTNEYYKKDEWEELFVELQDVTITKRIISYIHNCYSFERLTFPKEVLEFEKSNKVSKGVDEISKVDLDDFSNILDDSFIDSHIIGGNTAFNSMGINKDFQSTDKSTISLLNNNKSKISQNLSNQINSKLKFEILQGIKEGESPSKISNRIKKVYSNPITVNVKARFDSSGKMISKAYSYEMSPNEWARVVSSTEVNRAFNQGKIDAWAQTGVVEALEFVISPDERVCPICSALEGTTYTIEESRGVIPAHAVCRCTFIAILTKKDYKNDAIANIETLYAV